MMILRKKITKNFLMVIGMRNNENIIEKIIRIQAERMARSQWETKYGIAYPMTMEKINWRQRLGE